MVLPSVLQLLQAGLLEDEGACGWLPLRSRCPKDEAHRSFTHCLVPCSVVSSVTVSIMGLATMSCQHSRY